MSPVMVSRDEALLDRIARHTGRRVVGLAVEWADETVVLRGQAPSFHVKQLATHAAREVLPGVPVRNAIQVTQTRH
jgi:hypothetical protein